MPDLNSVPPSPHSLAMSRRQSSNQMPPPPVPVPSSPSLNILPSNQTAVNQTASSLPALPSPHLQSTVAAATGQTPGDNTGVGAGPGPLRHPRPLTAAELHLQLEKEQEAVVNRLTRELSLLRAAQNASVVSNTSSTSAGASGTGEPPLVADTQPLLSGSGFSIPSSTVRQHHRTYSNTSARSASQIAHAGSATTPSVVGITAPAPTRPSAPSLSRQNSTASRRSHTNSPGPHTLHDPSYFRGMAAPVSTGPTPITGGGGGGGGELSPGLLAGTTRYEETAFYRAELDGVKRENEALKRRIRELERTVRERRASDASRTRSESISTTASMSVGAAGGGGGGTGAGIAGRREGLGRERVVSSLSVAGSVGVGVPEDEVRVGESAASAGLAAQGSQAPSQP